MGNITVDHDHLTGTVIPALFADPAGILEYGSLGRSSKVDELSDLMESGAVTGLAKLIEQILSGMSDASPEKIARKPKVLDRLLGKHLEAQVRYQVARSSLEQLLEEAQAKAQGVRDTVSAINRLIDQHAADVDALQVYIHAGHAFLQDNPDVGAVQAGALEFDRPRERFARKLSNLATLLASHELSINQMKLSRAQAIDLLDRFEETVSILLPVWRQHTLTLITTKNMSPDMIAAASKAHQALVHSLSASLDGIKH